MAKTSLDIIVGARDRASKHMYRIEKSVRSLRRTVVSTAGAIGVYFSGRAVARFASESIEAFGKQEQAVIKLRAALDLLGKGTDESVRDMEAFASSIQAVTTMGDEAVLELAALGASMGQLSGKQLKEATTAAIGLSKAFGIDTLASMRLVARAAVGDTATLTRYGIKLDATLSPQEKFNELLRIGAKNFNIAKAEAQSTTGQLQQFSNQWGDLKEQIGAALSGPLMLVTRWMRDFTSGLQDAGGELQTLQDMGFEAAKFAAIYIGEVADALAGLQVRFYDAAAGVNELLLASKKLDRFNIATGFGLVNPFHESKADLEADILRYNQAANTLEGGMGRGERYGEAIENARAEMRMERMVGSVLDRGMEMLRRHAFANGGPGPRSRGGWQDAFGDLSGGASPVAQIAGAISDSFSATLESGRFLTGLGARSESQQSVAQQQLNEAKKQREAMEEMKARVSEISFTLSGLGLRVGIP